MKIATIVLACIISLTAAGELLAQEPVRGLQDLIGTKGRDGEPEMNKRGYSWIRTDKSDDSSYSYWRDNRSGKCVNIRTSDGRYVSIVFAMEFDCTGNGGGNSVAPPANEIAGMEIFYNVKRNGGDYNHFTVDTLEQCAEACSIEDRCQSFNFGIERQDCWLKSNVPQGVQNNTVISGVRRR